MASVNITVAGASYQDVPAVTLPLTGGGTATFTEITDTTATASDVASGKIFYTADGTQTTGTASGGGGGSTTAIPYGYCTTAAATAAKAVTVSPAITELTAGTQIIVRFQYAQTATNPTLNVNSLGAVRIYRTSVASITNDWVANEIVMLVYDGTYWVTLDGGTATTTYIGTTKLSSNPTNTSTTLALTPLGLNNVMQNIATGAPVYSASSTYAVGDRVRHEYSFYECSTAITTAEAWNAAHWTALDPLQTQIDSINSQLDGVETLLAAI